MAQVIAFYNKKGGIGKTSLTTNLATLLAKDGFNVLVIDTDSQSNVVMSWGLNPYDKERKNTYDLMIGEPLSPADTIQVRENLSVLPASLGLANLDLEIYSNLKEHRNPLNLLNKGLTDLKDVYDYILLDTPSALTLATLSALVAANHVVIPFAPEPYAVSGFMNLLETLDTINQRKTNPTQILGVVKMLVDSRTNLHKGINEQLLEYTITKGIRVFDTQISRSIETPNSIAYTSQPLTEKGGTSKTLTEYLNLYAEIKEALNHESSNQTKK